MAARPPPAPPQSDDVRRWRPGLTSLLLGVAFSFGLTTWLRLLDPRTGPVGWYASVVWSLPIVLTVQGIAGGLLVRSSAARRSRSREPSWVSSQSLIVVVPTIGRADTHAALTRALVSFCACLPAHFARVRVDVVVEQDCETTGALLRLAERHPSVRVLTVPRDFRTPAGTRFKARANHYADQVRQREGQATRDVWVLHMDDDTSIDPYTAAEIARFVDQQGAVGEDDQKDLVQGILTYPRELARSRLSWYADAVRPGCDVSFFPVTTGRGKPRFGLHGELLLVRASVEAEIGWDFGPRTIVEDAEFAMHFCDAHPGRSAWFHACSYGASPATVTDFVKQRERWVWGLLTMLLQRSVPLRRRLLLLPTIGLWVGAPFANPVVLISVGVLIGNADTTPPSPVIGLVWAVNFGFYVWLYWEGFKINVRASADARIRWWEPVVIVAGTPVFALMECLGILFGVARFLQGGQMHFTVISKPV